MVEKLMIWFMNRLSRLLNSITNWRIRREYDELLYWSQDDYRPVGSPLTPKEIRDAWDQMEAHALAVSQGAKKERGNINSSK